MTTLMRSLAAVDFEIDALKNRALAERALEAIGHDPGSLCGSATRLKQLEAERERLSLEEHGHRLVALLGERATLRDRVDQLTAEHDARIEELRSLEQDATIIRWKAAPAIARRLGLGQNFDGYVNWVLSNFGPAIRNSSNAPLTEAMKLIGASPGVPSWPTEILFEDETSRATCRRLYTLTRDISNLECGRSDALGRIQAIEKSFPEISAVLP